MFFKVFAIFLWFSILCFSTAFSQQSKSLEGKQQVVDDVVLDIPQPQINYTAFGLLIQDITPLWKDMWQGTNQGSVVRLIEQASKFQDLPSTSRLLYSLLISESYPPYTLEGSLKSNLPYARSRIEWLIDKGYTSEALRLIGFIPEEYRFSWFGGLLVDLNLANSDYAKVCEYVERSGLQDERDSLYRDKVRIFCSLLGGEREEAEFLFTIYLDSKEDFEQVDMLFSELVNYSLFGILPEDGYFSIELSKVRPLHISMLSVTELPSYFRDESVEVSPLLLGMLSRTSNLVMEERILMAERLLVLHPNKRNELRSLYALFALKLLSSNKDISPGDKNLPISHKLALLYVQITADKYVQQKALYLREALTISEKDGRWYAVVRLLEDELLSLSTTDELAWLAPEMIRALLALGEMDAARSWYNILDRESVHKRGLFSLLLSLDSKNAEEQNLIASDALWAKDMVTQSDQATADDLLLFDTLLAIYEWQIAEVNPQALDDFAILRDMWLGHNLELLSKTLPVEQPLWSLVSSYENAIANNRKGQAVLLAGLLLSSYFVLPPATLVNVLKGLDSMGLKEEAKVIAREYILLYLYR